MSTCSGSCIRGHPGPDAHHEVPGSACQTLRDSQRALQSNRGRGVVVELTSTGSIIEAPAGGSDKEQALNYLVTSIPYTAVTEPSAAPKEHLRVFAR